jgi:adenine-specific DNA glycosylase
MLQRTKADQVQSVYLDFFSLFKTPFDVAQADIKKLNGILYPLGLRWRIKKFGSSGKCVGIDPLLS